MHRPDNRPAERGNPPQLPFRQIGSCVSLLRRRHRPEEELLPLNVDQHIFPGFETGDRLGKAAVLAKNGLILVAYGAQYQPHIEAFFGNWTKEKLH